MRTVSVATRSCEDREGGVERGGGRERETRGGRREREKEKKRNLSACFSLGKRRNAIERRAHLLHLSFVASAYRPSLPAAAAAGSEVVAARSQRNRQSLSSLLPSTMAPASESLDLSFPFLALCIRAQLGSQGGEQIQEVTLRLSSERNKTQRSWEQALEKESNREWFEECLWFLVFFFLSLSRPQPRPQQFCFGRSLPPHSQPLFKKR